MAEGEIPGEAEVVELGAEEPLVCRGCLANAGEMKNMYDWGLNEEFFKITDIKVCYTIWHWHEPDRYVIPPRPSLKEACKEYSAVGSGSTVSLALLMSITDGNYSQSGLCYATYETASNTQ